MLYALIASLLVAIVYIRFLRQMDVFEPEHWRYTLICFFLGVMSVGLVYPLYLYLPQIAAIPEDGSFLIRLRFHMQAVASIEELVKILPFLILLNRKKIINESFDYIKYASVGAMGFAALENVLYFNKSLHIIEQRAFYTAVMHMFTSSVIAYILYVAKNKWRIPAMIAFIPGYLVAVFCHGLFNSLVSTQASYLIGIVQVIMMLLIWGRMMNNTLNHSEFFQAEPVQQKIRMAGFQLLLGWGLVFLYAAISIGMTENWAEAIQFIQEGLLFGVLSGIGLFWLLARPIIRQGKWFPLLGKVKKD